MKLKDSKAKSIVLIAVIYVAAVVLGVWIFRLLPEQTVFARVFVADTAATVFVYLAGLVLGNASVYDPYWSVAPLVVLPGLALYYGANTPGAWLLLAVVAYWGLRLTLNWAYVFQNLRGQDWRYTMLKEKSGKLFPLVSFFGIHYVPTLVVYVAMVPGMVFLQRGAPLSMGVLLGCVLCACGATLQLVADAQMHRFRKTAKRGQLIRVGLWQYARHPNYLGEILMWWGVFIVGLAAAPAQWPMLLVGPVANTLLFMCISIPVADARYRREKPGYAAYRAQTRMLLPVKKAAPEGAVVGEETPLV